MFVVINELFVTDDAAYAAYCASDAFHAAHSWPGHAPIDHSRLTTYHVHTGITATAEHRP